MRYQSNTDGTMLRRKSLGPAAALSQRQFAMPVPGRGESAGMSRYALRGFGDASTSAIGAAGSAIASRTSGSVSGAASGASVGASVGSVIPLIGTAVGAVLGAVGGAIAGSLGKKDPEQYNFDAAVSLWQQNPDAVYNIANKYLPLAGLFDLNIKTNIPIYRKFGHMGEQAFVNAMVSQLYNAAVAGRISASDSAVTIFNNIIQPWINSFGYGAMSDPHADLINRLMIGMVYDWITGAWKNWRAVGGDFPFGNLPSFPGFQQPTASATPSPVATPNTAPTSSNAAGGILQQVAANQAPPTVSMLTHDVLGQMVTPIGVFYSSQGGDYTFKPNGSATQIQIALTPQHTGSGGTLQITWNGTAAVATNNDGSVLIFNPTNFSWAPATSGATTASTPLPPSPPAPGTAITSGLDSVTKTMVALPSGAVFQGLTSGGAWIIQYPTGPNAGSYTINSGVLTPYGTQPTTGQTSIPVPAGYSLTPQTIVISGTTYPLYADAAGSLYVWSGSQMIPYSSAAQSDLTSSTSAPVGGGGGGSGGFYPGYSPPTQSQAQAVDTPVTDSGGGSFSPWLLLAGAAGLYFLLEG